MSKQIIIDYQEYLEMQAELDSFRKPLDRVLLSENEQQEATGILMIRCLQNPALFRHATDPIDLGKFRAIFEQAFFKEDLPVPGTPRLLIKFERT